MDGASRATGRFEFYFRAAARSAPLPKAQQDLRFPETEYEGAHGQALSQGNGKGDRSATLQPSCCSCLADEVVGLLGAQTYGLNPPSQTMKGRIQTIHHSET